MESNFPGNNGAVALEVFWSAVPFIVVAALAAAMAAWCLSALTRRFAKRRRAAS